MSKLVVENLRVEIDTGSASNPRLLKPVDGVSFEIGPNECVALLGESGCGKSLTALALMRLLPDGGYELVGKATRQVFRFEPVMGSACTQEGSDQSSAYCHTCHAVKR